MLCSEMSILGLFVGGLFLYLGAEWLVAGASRVALAFRIPQITIGLTVVAYGTSAPEIAVGIEAAIGGHPDVTLGNVFGSNIANLGLILGASALVRPARVDGTLRARELPVLLAVTLALPLLMLDGVVSRVEGVILCVSAVIYTVWTVRLSRGDASEVERATRTAEAVAEASNVGGAPIVARRHALVAIGGLIILLVGGKTFVASATEVALAYGVSERVLGLTVVALGTSLPELATCLIAAVRGHSDIAVGNVLGSNLFNVLVCLGASAAARPLASAPTDHAVELGTLLAMTAVGGFFLRTARTMSRAEGAVLLVGYAGFLGYLAR